MVALIPYFALALVSGIGGLVFCELKKNRKHDLLFLVVMSAAMVALAVIRGPSVGIDYEWVYKNYFLTVDGQSFGWLFTRDNMYIKEPVYGLLNWLISLVTNDPLVMIGVVSSVIILLRMFFVWRYSSSVWVSVFVYISCGFFGYSLCTLRQELGISVAMFAIPFLQKRKIVPYMLLILLAGMCHNSLLVLLPVYFLANLPLNKITLSVYGGGTIFMLLFSDPIIGWFTSKVDRFSMYKPGSYFMMGRSFNTIFIPLVFFIVIILTYKKLLELNPENLVLVNLYLYATALFVLATKNFVFQRLALILLPTLLVLLPELFRCYDVDERKYQEMYDLESSGKKKQNLQRYNNLKARRREEKSLYYAAIGMIMAASLLYLAFLCSANTLDLVPYLTRWQPVPAPVA